MPCVPMKIGKTPAIVCGFEPEFKIRVGTRAYLFEWHHYFGPAALYKRNGAVNTNVPDSFYVAAEAWDRQGRKVDADGWCVWAAPSKEEGRE